jgi:hypothetical protein
MKNYTVSFEITTIKYSLDELSKRIGLNCSSGSFDKGKIYHKKNVDHTVWKLFSDVDKSLPLEEHIKNIFTEDLKKRVLRPGVLSEDSKLVLNIGVFYSDNYASCSFRLSSECIQLIKDYELEIEVSCYPCTD